jgi:hypothetical protein
MCQTQSGLVLERVQADWKGGGRCHIVMARLVVRAMTNRVIATIPVSLKRLQRPLIDGYADESAAPEAASAASFAETGATGRKIVAQVPSPGVLRSSTCPPDCRAKP